MWDWVDPLGLCKEETETFYRAVSSKELQRIEAADDIVPRKADYFVTQNQDYTEHLMFKSKPKTRKKYDHLLRFEAEKGTKEALEKQGQEPKINPSY